MGKNWSPGRARVSGGEEMTMPVFQTLPKLKGVLKPSRKFLKDSGYEDEGGDMSEGTDEGSGAGDGYTYNEDGSGSFDDGFGNVTEWDANGNVYAYGQDGSGTAWGEDGSETSWNADGNIIGYTYNEDGSGSYTGEGGEVTTWDADGNVKSNFDPAAEEAPWYQGLLDMFGGSKGSSGKGSSFSPTKESKATTTKPKEPTKTAPKLPQFAQAQGSSFPTETVLLLGAAGAVLYFITKRK